MEGRAMMLCIYQSVMRSECEHVHQYRDAAEHHEGSEDPACAVEARVWVAHGSGRGSGNFGIAGSGTMFGIGISSLS